MKQLQAASFKETSHNPKMPISLGREWLSVTFPLPSSAARLRAVLAGHPGASTFLLPSLILSAGAVLTGREVRYQ